MPPAMFKKRTGTGEFYAVNLPRKMRHRLMRGVVRSNFPRGDNTKRPWLSDQDTIEFDFTEILRQTEQQWHEMLDSFAWIGDVVTFCLRRRQHMSDQTREDADGWIEWFLVLHTVGLLDRRGTWLGPGLAQS
ncbi:MAG: hypothetical protein FJ100_08310 [Deltaproteobacteria bacterium]|nr:hypothetical protein [Deltaproteobacteria bacterium]